MRTVCDVALTGRPVALATGDFDRDGNPDLAVVNQSANQVVILLTDPQAFQTLDCIGALSRADVSVGTNPVAIAVGDLDGNLTLDLAVATQAGISILRGNGTGMFDAQTAIPGGIDPQAVAIADVNGDNRADIIVGNGSPNTITILLGAAENEFALANAIVLPAGAPISFLIATDLNLDAEPDIAAGSTLTGDIRVFLHDETVTPEMFRAAQTIDVGTAPAAIAAVDLSRDAMPDLVVVGGGVNGALQVFENRLPGNPAFTLVDTHGNVGSRPSSVAAGNLDDDFDPDLAVAIQDEDVVPFYFGLGDGTVALGPGGCNRGGDLCEVGAMPRAVALADVDADGRPDAITANQGGGGFAPSLSFLLSSAPPTPTFTASPRDTPQPTETPALTPTPAFTVTPTPTPPCFVPRPQPGCPENQPCEDCVCGLDDFCCDEMWDLSCVQNALGSCAGSCGIPTPTPSLAPSETPTVTLSPRPSETPSVTHTFTQTPTGSRSRTPTPTHTPTPTVTLSATVTPTGPTPTISSTPSVTLTPSLTPTVTLTPTPRATSTLRCVGEGMNQICTSGDTCALRPDTEPSATALLLLLPALIGIAVRRVR
jgi:hypothetical protein